MTLVALTSTEKKTSADNSGRLVDWIWKVTDTLACAAAADVVLTANREQVGTASKEVGEAQSRPRQGPNCCPGSIRLATPPAGGGGGNGGQGQSVGQEEEREACDPLAI
jgi:hypothetical protein